MIGPEQAGVNLQSRKLKSEVRDQCVVQLSVRQLWRTEWVKAGMELIAGKSQDLGSNQAKDTGANQSLSTRDKLLGLRR